MRLRLRIERNSLPVTQALWPVKDRKCTIAQLLQHINETFPLESDTWGLEDYSVSVGGYECLHWHEVQAVCKEDDEVTIKSLQWADVRARTLTGRAQISQDGRHLVDGVPFGRSNLKGPVRPDITIPPRKKRRLLKDTEDDESAEQLFLTENGEELHFQDEDEDEEDDGDFEVESSEDDLTSGTSSSEEDGESSEESESDSSDTSSSDSSSSDTSDSESESDATRKPAKTPAAVAKQAALQGSKKLGSATRLNNGIVTGKKRRSPDQGAELPEAKRKKLPPTADSDLNEAKNGATSNGGSTRPHEGKQATKDRNARRRDSRKLKALVSQNKLPKDATLETLRQWQRDNEGAQASLLSTGHTEVAPNGIGTDVDDVQSEVLKANASEASTSGTNSKKRKRGKSEANASAGAGSSEEMDQQRQKLLSAIESGGVDVTIQMTAKKLDNQTDAAEEDEDEPPTELSAKPATPAALSPSDILEADLNIAADGTPTSAQRRKQLDVASSRRLLFGSLGVRAPKTQEERDRIQQKLAGRATRTNPLQKEESTGEHVNGTITLDVTDVEAANQNDEASHTWKTRIHLTAVECCEEGVRLSTPPFPFFQRWDPQQRKKNRNLGVYQARNGRKRGKAHVVETYDKYNTNGEGDGLEYDDVDADDEYWEDGALLGDDYEVQDEEDEEEDDGFPPLPEDISTLTAVLEDDAKVGDFIAYTELACDESTEWQPKTVTRMAKIHERLIAEDGEGQWVLEMSSRDRKAKNFDTDGNRVYSKFEMPGDDAEDDGRKEVVWQELGDVKVVLRAGGEVGGAR